MEGIDYFVDTGEPGSAVNPERRASERPLRRTSSACDEGGDCKCQRRGHEIHSTLRSVRYGEEGEDEELQSRGRRLIHHEGGCGDGSAQQGDSGQIKGINNVVKIQNATLRGSPKRR